MVPQRTRLATSTPPWTSFSPASDRGDHQIDEAQLRKELGAAIARLRKLGYLIEQ
jgi:hypothetical protein